MKNLNLDEALGINTKTKNSTKSKSNSKTHTKKTKTMKCDNCGSSDLTETSSGVFKCNNCHSQIYLKNNIVNNFVTLGKNSQESKTDNIYALNPLINENQFLRKIFYTLSIVKTSPIDILDSKFCKVSLMYKEFAVSKVTCKGSYTASVGFDKKEQYEDTEKYWDSQLHCYRTKTVVKTRTVTEWRPISGNIDEDHIVCVGINEEDDDLLDDTIIDSLNEIENNKILFKDSDIEFEYSKIASEDNELIKSKASSLVDVSLPGDHKKDYNEHISSSIIESTTYILPIYSIDYVYNNETYNLYAIACNNSGLLGNYPNFERDIKNVINKKSRSLGITSIATSIITMFYCLISMLFIRTNGSLWGVVILSFLTILFRVLYCKIYTKNRNEIEKYYKSQKLGNLKKLISEHNLQELSVDELKEFN